MPIRVRYTAERKVDFSTMEPGKVSMYVCGVQFMTDATLVMHDVILLTSYTGGRHRDMMFDVQNFTDIDDKIIHRQTRQGDGNSCRQEYQTYYEDMDALNILRADDYHVAQIVDDMIRILKTSSTKDMPIKPKKAFTSMSNRLEKYGVLTGQNIEAFVQCRRSSGRNRFSKKGPQGFRVVESC